MSVHCDVYRRPEMTVRTCWGDPRGRVIGRVQSSLPGWSVVVRVVDPYGREIRRKSDRFLRRNRAEARMDELVRGMTTESFGGARRRRRRRR